MVTAEDFISRLQRACERLLEEAGDGDVAIDEEALAAVVKAAQEAGLERHPPARMPLKFDDKAHEANYTCLIHCLDFGSAYDDLLLQKMGRTSRECVEFGLMSLHLDGRNLDARYLSNFSKQNVFTYFGVDATVEEEVRPGIMLTKAGPLAGWVEKVATALQDVGRATVAAGQPSLGAWVLNRLSSLGHQSDGTAGEEPQLAEHRASMFVEWLVTTVPGFSDSPVIASSPDIRFARKAQSLAAAMDVAGSDRLCLDSGPNSLQALQGAGVVKVTGAAAAALADQADLAGNEIEARLRAAIVRVGILAKEMVGQQAVGLSARDVLWHVLNDAAAEAASTAAVGALRDMDTTAF